MSGIGSDQTESGRGLARGVAVFSSFTMLSRVLGLVRDIVWALFFPPDLRGAFIFAWRIPNAFRDLVAEGAANAAYVPVFSEYFTTKSRDEVKRLIGAVTTVTVLILAVLTAIGIAAAPVLGTFVRGLQSVSAADGPTDENLALTIKLTRLVFPYLFLIGVTALGMGLLTSLKSFAAPAFSPVLLNVSIIAACFLLKDRFDPPVMSLVVGVLVGGLAQVILLFGTLARRGIYPRLGLALSHPGLRMMGLLLLPTLVGQAVGQVNLLVDSIFADSLGPEKVSSLYFANRLLQLPLGVFGVAISTVALATMSTYATRGETGKLVETLRRGLGMVCFFTFPAAIGLAVLREPVIRLLFQHGAHFDEAATEEVAYALLFYLIGMASFASVKTLVSAFYSMKETRVPVLCASISMVANVGLNFLLIRPLQIGGLALATTISFTLNLVLLVTMLRRRLGTLGLTQVARAASRIGVSAALMGLAVWSVLRWTTTITSSAAISGRLVQVAGPIAVGVIVYFALCRLFRVTEVGEFLAGFGAGKRPAGDRE
jgi:putative peptidoglycan lipid II flippase